MGNNVNKKYTFGKEEIVNAIILGMYAAKSTVHVDDAIETFISNIYGEDIWKQTRDKAKETFAESLIGDIKSGKPIRRSYNKADDYTYVEYEDIINGTSEDEMSGYSTDIELVEQFGLSVMGDGEYLSVMLDCMFKVLSINSIEFEWTY